MNMYHKSDELNFLHFVIRVVATPPEIPRGIIYSPEAIFERGMNNGEYRSFIQDKKGSEYTILPFESRVCLPELAEHLERLRYITRLEALDPCCAVPFNAANEQVKELQELLRNPDVDFATLQTEFRKKKVWRR